MHLKIIKETESECRVKENKRSCIDCHTTTTPLWRGGPAGPRSLCNACGIRHRKQRMGLLGVDKYGQSKRKKNNNTSLVKSGFLFLREEEQAAMLLMALSCGSVTVYA